MRIQFDGVDLKSRSGPNSFASRLARRLTEMGHDLTFSCDADVSLVFIQRSGQKLSNKVVQRLDGIWFSPEQFHTHNVNIKKLYDDCDAVVWQSEFDRTMTTRWWNSPRSGTIIRNGTTLDRVQSLTIPALVEMRNSYEKMYVASSNWHGQKRLKSNIELFKRLQVATPNSCLIVLGSNPDCVIADPCVFYAGNVDHETCNEIYAAVDWMLHLAWADHCPNVVIEALAQGTPVVCSSVGGTRELIGNYGLVVRDDDYDFSLVDYDNPPLPDLSGITTLVNRAQLDYSTISDIDICSVAKRYVELFEGIIQ